MKARGDAKLAEMYPALAATEEEMMPATPGVQRVDSRSGVVYNDLDSSPMGSARSRPDESDLTAHVLRTLQGVGGGDEGADTAAQIGRLRALVASAIALRRVAGTLVGVGVPSVAHAADRGACKHSKNWCLLFLPFGACSTPSWSKKAKWHCRVNADTALTWSCLTYPMLPCLACAGSRSSAACVCG